MELDKILSPGWFESCYRLTAELAALGSQGNLGEALGANLGGDFGDSLTLGLDVLERRDHEEVDDGGGDYEVEGGRDHPWDLSCGLLHGPRTIRSIETGDAPPGESPHIPHLGEERDLPTIRAGYPDLQFIIAIGNRPACQAIAARLG